MHSACQMKIFPFWDCSDDNNCGFYKSCRKTGTWPDFLCLCVDIRCDTYNLTTGLCTLCKSGLVPTATGNYCSPIIPQCNVYKDDHPDGFCQTCLIGYTVTEGGACSQNITNCTSYSNPGQCKICNQGYVLFNNNAQCVPIISNCLSYNLSDSRICQTCEPSFALTESAFHCVNKINNCVTYYDIGTCKICQQNYSTSETAINCAKNILNCYVYDDLTTNCKKCSGNFVITQNGIQCVSKIPECEAYSDSSGNCTTCQLGYVLISNINTCVPNITNCKLYDQYGTCQECISGFNRSETGRNCSVPIAGCAILEDFTGRCKQCNEPYNRTQNGKQCVPSIEFCEVYDDDSGKCLSCLNNLIVSTSGKRCCSFIPNCLNYSDISDTCSLCSENYLSAQNGLRCLKSIENCNFYNYTCVLAHDVSDPNFNCFQTIPDCKIFNDPNPNCKVCWTNCTESSDFPVISGNQNIECSGSLTNCEHFEDETLTCLKCDLNFAMTQTGVKCVIKIEDCFIYDDLTGLCQKCNPPKVLNLERNFCSNQDPQNLQQENSKLKLILIIVLSSVGGFFIILGIYYWYKRRSSKPKWPSKILGQGNNIIEHRLIDDNGEKEKLNHQSFGHHETKTISLGCALMKIGSFIENEKMKHEYFVYEILDEKDDFSNPLQVKIKEKIGKGGYGTVWKAYDYIDNYYALKVFLDKNEKDQITEEDLLRFKEMIKEKKNLRELKDENIIFIKGIAYSFGENNKLQLGIVEPLMDFDLKGFLQLYDKHLTMSRRLEIAMKISVGLKYMHYRKCIHNDIKPQNILINWEHENSKIDVKLSDFGTMQNEQDTLLNFGITLDYASPERILKSLMDVQLSREKLIQGDIWSLGCVLFKIFTPNTKEKIRFTWSFLLKSEKIKDQKVRMEIKNIIEQEEEKNNVYVDNKQISDEKIRGIINDCLQVKACKRPYMDEIIERLRFLELEMKN